MLGNDIKKAALRTFQVNHTGEHGAPSVLPGDIREISVDTIKETLGRQGIQDGELDCLIGGPPCQGFSQMRRSEERKGSEIVKFKGYNKLDQDPRNDLVLRFLEVASALRPKFIVIENVPQMLRHAHNGVVGGISAQVEAMLLVEMGYDVVIRKVNAADYGVPQLRERAIFIASRVSPATFPEPTHADPSRTDLLLFGNRPWVTVSDAIADLPSPTLGPRDDLGGRPVTFYADVELSEYARRMRSQGVFPYNHLTRHYSPSILRIISEMQPGETWDHASERMQKHYDKLVAQYQEPGEDWHATFERLSHQGIVNTSFYQKYYWSAYTRLAWDRPALTITANANFLGSGRFTHPEQQRGITMREAARLQSFDDDFRFITSPDGDEDTTRIGVGLDMIGEAVPPLLAEALANHIGACLDKARDKEANEQHQSMSRLQAVSV